MGKYVGYIIIFAIFFSVKACNFQLLEKTKGVVVENRSFSYGSMRRSGSWRDEVPYPIAQFHGPATTQTKRIYIRRPEDIPDEEKNKITLQIDTSLHGEELVDAINDAIEEHERSNYVDSTYEISEYRTAEPTGAYFFKRYDLGDSIDVIYERGHVTEALVHTFFSYWLTLPAIEILILICIAWTGAYYFATKRYA